jgi:hypothetical protein
MFILQQIKICSLNSINDDMEIEYQEKEYNSESISTNLFHEFFKISQIRKNSNSNSNSTYDDSKNGNIEYKKEYDDSNDDYIQKNKLDPNLKEIHNFIYDIKNRIIIKKTNPFFKTKMCRNYFKDILKLSKNKKITSEEIDNIFINFLNKLEKDILLEYNKKIIFINQKYKIKKNYFKKSNSDILMTKIQYNLSSLLNYINQNISHDIIRYNIRRILFDNIHNTYNNIYKLIFTLSSDQISNNNNFIVIIQEYIEQNTDFEILKPYSNILIEYLSMIFLDQYTIIKTTKLKYTKDKLNNINNQFKKIIHIIIKELKKYKYKDNNSILIDKDLKLIMNLCLYIKTLIIN